MTAEGTIASALERRLGSLSRGHRHLIRLEQDVYDGVQWMPGPHPVGLLEPTQGGLSIKLFPTRAGRTARALLEEELLDVTLSDSYPPAIRLTDLNLGGMT